LVRKLETSHASDGKGVQTAKGRERHEVIIRTAARLFAERGYDSVTINDIGYDAGVTGPAIYRHFSSKEAILVSIYAKLFSTSTSDIERIASTVPAGVDQLIQLIDGQIALVLDQPEAIRIVHSEWRNLPVPDAVVLRREAAQSRRVWINAVAASRPDLEPASAQIAAHAVLATINSISRRRKTKPLASAELIRLREMVVSSVFGGVAAPHLPTTSD
jgi:AcrR family transcriptional regulator